MIGMQNFCQVIFSQLVTNAKQGKKWGACNKMNHKLGMDGQLLIE
jgi:hypothetical protein